MTSIHLGKNTDIFNIVAGPVMVGAVWWLASKALPHQMVVFCNLGCWERPLGWWERPMGWWETSMARWVPLFPMGLSWKTQLVAPNRYETLGNKWERTDPWATLLCRRKMIKWLALSYAWVLFLKTVSVAPGVVAERGVHLHTLDKSIFDVPGFGPPVPQQLESCHLFRGEVSSQEVDGVFGKVRGDDHTH